METENPRKLPVFWIIIGIIFVLIIALCVFLSFKLGFMKTMMIFIGIVWFFAILGLIIWAVVWLFSKQRSDMIHIFKQRVLVACRLFRPPYVQEVWIWGDSSNSIPSRRIGYSEGVCKIKTKPTFEVSKEKQKDGTIKEVKTITEQSQDLYLLAFNDGAGFPFSLFRDTLIFLGKREDISDFDGSKVFLYGVLAPEVYGCLTLARHWEHTGVIDEPIKETIYRYVIQDFLKEIKNITDDALGISPEHQKRLERSNMESLDPKSQQQR